MIPWTRLFGLGLTDLFTGTGFHVDLEKDLSVKKQLVDAVVIERHAVATLPDPPDGLEDLGAHNLVSFKSHQDTLDAWALDELLGHFVNYRKQLTDRDVPLIPVSEFRLIAVTARYPRQLESTVALTKRKPGVYEVVWGVRTVRVLVLRDMAREQRNAMWEMFSAVPERVQEGVARYHWKQPDLSSVTRVLFEHYQLEGVNMPYTVEDFKLDLAREAVAKVPHRELLKLMSEEERLEGLSPEARLRGLPPEERLRGLPPEERLRGLPPEERLRGLPPEELAKRLPPEDMLKSLSREQILEYLNKLEKDSPTEP